MYLSDGCFVFDIVFKFGYLEGGTATRTLFNSAAPKKNSDVCRASLCALTGSLFFSGAELHETKPV